MRRAFTLIELVVAIAVLVIVSSFAGAIFNVSVNSQRTAAATAEIMQKLRAITDQLNADFRGIRKDAPMAIQFWIDDVDGTRRDSVALFANGDFQSVRQYPTDTAPRTVAGNVASIYYGRVTGPTDPNNILARKQKILTSDTSLVDSPFMLDPNEFLIDSLSVWRLSLDDISFVDWVPPFALDVDPFLQEGLPLYVMGGVGNFMIQVSEWNPIDETFMWGPGNEHFTSFVDSDDNGRFGFFYNAPLSEELVDWYDPLNWPKALKFTFTLYDYYGDSPLSICG
ncbi:MAG: prepilin-type N-terminal cleavage/methylation domain-containing protein [Planctomycetota bacterium]|jgi:prepilin-type N-terminal cleavage/methylation domain-containing protein